MYRYFTIIYIHLEKGMTFHLNNIVSPLLKIDLGLVWLKFHIVSVEQQFIILSIYLRNFDIISPWISVWLYILTKVNPLHTRMFVSSLLRMLVIILRS